MRTRPYLVLPLHSCGGSYRDGDLALDHPLSPHTRISAEPHATVNLARPHSISLPSPAAAGVERARSPLLYTRRARSCEKQPPSLCSSAVPPNAAPSSILHPEPSLGIAYPRAVRSGAISHSPRLSRFLTTMSSHKADVLSVQEVATNEYQSKDAARLGELGYQQGQSRSEMV